MCQPGRSHHLPITAGRICSSSCSLRPSCSVGALMVHVSCWRKGLSVSRGAKWLLMSVPCHWCHLVFPAAFYFFCTLSSCSPATMLVILVLPFCFRHCGFSPAPSEQWVGDLLLPHSPPQPWVSQLPRHVMGYGRSPITGLTRRWGRVSSLKRLSCNHLRWVSMAG